jgi:hypothetical protein
MLILVLARNGHSPLKGQSADVSGIERVRADRCGVN